MLHEAQNPTVRRAISFACRCCSAILCETKHGGVAAGRSEVATPIVSAEMEPKRQSEQLRAQRESLTRPQ
jgi:hypothetical protein